MVELVNLEDVLKEILVRDGVDVTVLERASAAPRRGAAVDVDDRELERITGIAPATTVEGSS